MVDKEEGAFESKKCLRNVKRSNETVRSVGVLGV